MAQSVALNFLSPILGLVGAKFILHEKFNKHLTCSLILSFAGSSLILYPEWQRLQLESIRWVLLLPILAAFLLAMSKLLTRKLGLLGEKPAILSAYLLFFSSPIALIPALFEWTWPNNHTWPWLIALGVLSGLAHWSFSKAYHLASVSYLTPFGFAKFFISALIGYWAFNELPENNSTWLGIALILLAVVVSSHSKKQA